MIWFDDNTTVVDLLTSLLTPAIAIFAAYIGWQQWKTNKANLKERLFERRWLVFRETQAFLSEILAHAKYSDESYWKFTDTCQRSRFLFPMGISDHLLEIRERAGNMRLFQVKYSELPVGEERSKFCEQEGVELKWLSGQLDEIFKKFRPFLAFDNK